MLLLVNPPLIIWFLFLSIFVLVSLFSLSSFSFLLLSPASRRPARSMDSLKKKGGFVAWRRIQFVCFGPLAKLIELSARPAKRERERGGGYQAQRRQLLFPLIFSFLLAHSNAVCYESTTGETKGLFIGKAIPCTSSQCATNHL